MLLGLTHFDFAQVLAPGAFLVADKLQEAGDLLGRKLLLTALRLVGLLLVRRLLLVLAGLLAVLRLRLLLLALVLRVLLAL